MINLLIYEQEKSLDSYLKNNKTYTIGVAPNATIADRYRPLVDEILTLPDFLLREISPYKKDFSEKSLSKSDLLLKLASYLKTSKLKKDFNSFMNLFHFITDIRSVSLNDNIFSSLIDEAPLSLKDSLLVLWNTINEENLLDEPRGYQLLESLYREDRISKQEPLLFVGFKQLGGIQIDCIKEIAKKRDVFFPIHRYVYEKSRDNMTTWISWLEMDAKIVFIDKKSIPHRKKFLKIIRSEFSLLDQSISHIQQGHPQKKNSNYRK